MEEPPAFLARFLRVIRQKTFALILLLACGEAALWLSGNAGFGLMLLLVIAVGLVTALGAVVRVRLDGRRQDSVKTSEEDGYPDSAGSSGEDDQE